MASTYGRKEPPRLIFVCEGGGGGFPQLVIGEVRNNTAGQIPVAIEIRAKLLAIHLSDLTFIGKLVIHFTFIEI